MENVYKVTNFLLPEELEEIDRILTDENLWSLRSEKKEDPNLGRIMYTAQLSQNTLNSIQNRVSVLLNKTVKNISLVFAHYEAKHGQPNLPPHFDGDNNDVIVDYQYKSNTSWGLGVATECFEIQDNEALIFNPNQYPHWRPKKEFKDGEFVTMIFFRFPESGINYGHLTLSQSDPIFDEAKAARNLLG
jgi:hypothetical protein